MKQSESLSLNAMREQLKENIPVENPNYPSKEYQYEEANSVTEMLGWSYPFQTLPRWGLHDHPSYYREVFVAEPSGKYALLTYNIAEVRMGCNVGDVAVFGEKENPKLLFNLFYMVPSYYRATFKGDILYLPIFFPSKELQSYVRLVLIIDLKLEEFSYVQEFPDYATPCPPCPPNPNWYPFQVANELEKWFIPV